MRLDIRAVRGVAGVRPRTEVWRVLDKCPHMRNVAEYEGTLDVGERIVIDLVAVCEMVAARIERPSL